MTPFEIGLLIKDYLTAIAAISSSAALIMGIWNARKIQVIKLATDGMKDALVAATSEAAERKGAERGRVEQTAERKEEKNQ